MHLSVAALLPAAYTAPVTHIRSPIVAPRSAVITASTDAFDRRAALLGLGALLAPQMASAKIESVNPANNYYFPTAKYRYLPRILRAWIAVDQLGPVALEVGDWDGMTEVIRRADDAVTALPLYTNAVEGSRSTKRKTKTPAQKTMIKDLKAYDVAIKELEAAVNKKDQKKALVAIKDCRVALKEYRELAQIDGEDGGVIQLPLGNAEESGHAGAPLGYVVPVFRGGGVSMDYALKSGDPPMMINGMITKEYREKYQTSQNVAKK